MRSISVALTKDEANALVSRSDLLEAECRIKAERRVTWMGRLIDFRQSGYGVTGGSATDRRLIVSAMAKIENQNI